MRIFIALLIYIGIVSASNIGSYWDKDGLTIHRPMESITFFRFQQIKRYLYVSTLVTSRLLTAYQHTKLEPLASLLCTKFQAYVVLGQNVSFDEMMVPFAGRSKHTLKMKNKPVKEGAIDARFGSYRQKLQTEATAIVGSYRRRLTVSGPGISLRTKA